MAPEPEKTAKGLFFNPQTKLQWHLGQEEPKKLVCFPKEDFLPFFKLSDLVGLTWSK